ncbi:hypothetical protein LOD99_3 [Oopsacas minuta]|uniref:BZIP domain-containing protein n=1 Tax=Oopsacas minuta TaxID=111878 RepID=A0AAV7K8B7_9METZ|nr:hypothetical protein LOD99_3 [Oopsacas minuta]
MDSPTTPTTPNSCKYFEDYGLDAISYNMYYSMTCSALQSPEEVHRDICIRKCATVSPLLKDNWMDLIFKEDFPNLISLDKIVRIYSLQQLTDILANGDLLPEEREIIKKMRSKARNNKAAKNLRQKHKEQEMQVDKDVRTLENHKKELMNEKSELTKEILHYQSMGILPRNNE